MVFVFIEDKSSEPANTFTCALLTSNNLFTVLEDSIWFPLKLTHRRLMSGSRLGPEGWSVPLSY